MLYKKINGAAALPTRIPQTVGHSDSVEILPANTIFQLKISALANSFYNRTVSDWNILIVEVKLVPSPAAFKARLLQSNSCAAFEYKHYYLHDISIHVHKIPQRRLMHQTYPHFPFN